MLTIKHKTSIYYVVSIIGVVFITNIITTSYHQAVNDSEQRLRAFKLCMAGYEYLKNGESLRAMAVFGVASGYSPTWYGPHMGISEVYKKEGHLLDALEAARKAINLIHAYPNPEDKAVEDGDRTLIPKYIKDLESMISSASQPS